MEKIWLFFLAILIQQSAPERTCPFTCRCSPPMKFSFGTFQVTCEWLRTARIPEFGANITSVYIDTHLLHLQGDDFQDAVNLEKIFLKTEASLHIHRDTFKGLRRLVNVSVCSQQSIHIQSGAFTSIDLSLSMVRLKGNLMEIPFNHFCEHRKLLAIDISHNQLRSVRLTKCVEGWELFNELVVSHNPLQSVNGSDFYYLRHAPLKELRMYGCGLTVLTSGLFRFTPMLEVLDLGMNTISSLPHDLFHNLTRLSQLFLGSNLLHGTPLHDNHDIIPHLESLDLSFCKYMNISFGTQFRNATRMMGLHLSNRIIDLQEPTLANLNNAPLISLGLSSVKLTSVAKYALRPLRHLRVLTLSKTPIDTTTVLHNILRGISDSVRAIFLVKTGLSELEPKAFSSFSESNNLKFLKLANNNMTVIKGKTFAPLRNLGYLNLSKNKLERKSLRDNCFLGLESLKVLDLSFNYLGVVPNQQVVGRLPALTSLALPNYPLGRNANLSYMLRGLTKLEIADFSRCDISILPSMMFHDNSNLIKLRLKANSISSWDPYVFEPLKKLEVLTLGNNKIITVNANSFKFLKSLQVLELSHNPLACTCDLLWFREWVNTLNIFLPSYLGEGYFCASPPDMKGVLINDLAMTPIDCSSKTFLYLLSGSGGTFILTCLALTLTYRYRWYIRYYWFLVSARRRQARDALLEEERFQYDAYVCYHHTSRHWVINNLLPELEHRGGTKLCLHDRDWLAGPYILDNIVDSLDKSRKTLLVVNNEFVKSAWCREETTLAYHRLVQEQRNLLVVVLLENITYENLDNTMRTILTSRTYLTWPSKMKREKMFWKALRRAVGQSECLTGQIALGRP